MSLAELHVVQTLFLSHRIHRPYVSLGLASIMAPLLNRWSDPVPLQGVQDAIYITIQYAKDMDLNTMPKNKQFSQCLVVYCLMYISTNAK